jgi:hypothetical protein
MTRGAMRFEEHRTMRHHDDTMLYSLVLDIPERDGTLGDGPAIELLRSEFALALNASYFTALSAGDIQISAIWRSVGRQGITSYDVELQLDERSPELTDEQVAALLQHEFARAQNALHFNRIAAHDFSVALVGRERSGSHGALRAA